WMKDLLDILQAMSESKGRTDNPLELFLDMSERVVKYVATAFGAKTDEVAILFLTTDSRHLRFVAPRKFAELGTIPVTKRDSIGVAQISRKGETPAEAGPDFTGTDVRKAQDIFQAIARFLMAARPDRF